MAMLILSTLNFSLHQRTSPSVGSVREPLVKGEWGHKNVLLLFQLGSFTKEVEFQIKKTSSN